MTPSAVMAAEQLFEEFLSLETPFNEGAGRRCQTGLEHFAVKLAKHRYGPRGHLGDYAPHS